jgi:hypothetical protein
MDTAIEAEPGVLNWFSIEGVMDWDCADTVLYAGSSNKSKVRQIEIFPLIISDHFV